MSENPDHQIFERIKDPLARARDLAVRLRDDLADLIDGINAAMGAVPHTDDPGDWELTPEVILQIGKPVQTLYRRLTGISSEHAIISDHTNGLLEITSAIAEVGNELIGRASAETSSEICPWRKAQSQRSQAEM
jgi:hypothetical protein